MGKMLLIDASSGISGDMTVGALLSLGANEEGLKKAIASLKVPGFRIQISEVTKADILCCDFDVILDAEYDNHDHDMDYLYGHEKDGDYEVLTDLTEEAPTKDWHDHVHSHEHDHPHAHTHTEQERSLPDVIRIIDSCDMSEGAKAIAIKTFTILAEAEARVHGKSPENVHFHEVGALDSIADIIAAAYAFDNLGIEKVILTHLTDGHGSVRCRHGIIPVPVPAVNEIALANEIMLEICDVRGEMVTPTGAAFAAAVKSGSELPESYRIIKSGYGNGKRDYPARGYLAIHIIESDRD